MSVDHREHWPLRPKLHRFVPKKGGPKVHLRPEELHGQAHPGAVVGRLVNGELVPLEAGPKHCPTCTC